MNLLARLVKMRKDQDEEMRQPTESGGEVRNPRALLLWRRVMIKIREIMQIFEGNEHPELVALPEDGFSSGYLLPLSAQAPTVPALPTFPGHSTKQEQMAQQIKTGIPLPPRKSQQLPRVSVAACAHPTKSLCGGGNQHQKEVWCTDCHARWKVETTVRSVGAAGKAAVKASPLTTPTSLRTSLGSPTLSPPTSSMATPASPPATPKMMPVGMRCKCNAPAERMTVKKEGATKGRHFFKCHQRICDYFQWDPEEVRALQEAMASKSQKREPEVSPEVCRLREELEMEKRKLTEERLSMAQAQQVKEQETANQFEMMMNQANQRHQEMIEETQRRNENLLQESNQQHQQLLDVNDMAYRTHVQQLQHQLCWLTTLVGEERIQEVMNDPQKYAEASAQAQLLRENMNSVNQGPQ